MRRQIVGGRKNDTAPRGGQGNEELDRTLRSGCPVRLDWGRKNDTPYGRISGSCCATRGGRSHCSSCCGELLCKREAALNRLGDCFATRVGHTGAILRTSCVAALEHVVCLSMVTAHITWESEFHASAG